MGSASFRRESAKVWQGIGPQTVPGTAVLSRFLRDEVTLHKGWWNATDAMSNIAWPRGSVLPLLEWRVDAGQDDLHWTDRP